MKEAVIMKDLLATSAEFPHEEASAFEAVGLSHSTSGRTFLFQGDKPFKKFFLIQTAIVRAFIIIDDEDFTYCFFSTNDFCGRLPKLFNELYQFFTCHPGSCVSQESCVTQLHFPGEI